MAAESDPAHAEGQLPDPYALTSEVMAVQGLNVAIECARRIIDANTNAVDSMAQEVAPPAGQHFSISGKYGEVYVGRYSPGGHGGGPNMLNPRSVRRADEESPFLAASIVVGGTSLYAVAPDGVTARTYEPGYDQLGYSPLPAEAEQGQ